MSTSEPDRPRFVVVPFRPRLRVLLVAAAVLWLLSMAGAWMWASRRAAPELSAMIDKSGQQDMRLREQAALVDKLRQRVATLRRSDEISRSANRDVQETLAQRDEEIAGLRADIAFYERLVGSTGQRRGLSVHSIEFAPGASGTWQYAVTLTQNLNRGAVSKGALSLRIDGVRQGKLAKLEWPQLLQDPAAAQQPFEFRYFQKLEGSVILPADFTPRQVHVRLAAAGGSTVDKAFPWEAATMQGE